MRLNFNPTSIAFLDFESQSECELTTVSKYAVHPSTKVLTCCIKVDGEMHRFGPYLDDEDKAKMAAITEGCTICAHNAVFDESLWAKVAGLPEREWFDTLPCARAAGLPGQLDKLGKVLTGEGKDKNGTLLIKMLCIIRNGRVPAVGPAHQLLLDYNARDVELLETVYHRVKGFGEPDVIAADFAVNERGVPLDIPLLHALDAMYRRNTEKYGDQFSERTGGVNPKSSKQVVAWLAEQGYGVTGISKPAMNALLANHEELYTGDDDSKEAAAFEVVAEAVEMRREIAGVGRSKIDAALLVADSDGRAREQFVYHGAHTGRWTSRKLQLHNMPSQLGGLDTRAVEPAYEAVEALAEETSRATGQHITVADTLNMMLRRLVRVPNALVADYAGVEARCLAWMAGERTMMAAFSDPHGLSIYCNMGEKVFGRPIDKKGDPVEYALAKSLVLGCGYGMSGAKFALTIHQRQSRATVDALKRMGISIADSVKVYREAYPAVPALWKRTHDALHAAVRGEHREAGRCQFLMVGTDMHCILPSGRPIVYRNARVEMLVPGYAKMYGMSADPVPTVVYDNPRGYRGYLYGSKMTENCCQAACRDLLAGALVAAEVAGLTPIIHVHDELVCDAEERRLAELLTIMSVPPPWAAGFPLLVEGYSGPLWSKVSKGYREMNMMDGVRV